MSGEQRTPRAVGLVLAAGAGRRMGAPKALLRDATGEAWAARAARVLREGGCTPVLVTAGPRSDEVATALGASGATAPGAAAPGAAAPGAAAQSTSDAEVVVVPDAATGLSASLRAGLRAAAAHDPDVVVITLVDLPAVDAAAVASVLAAARNAPGGTRAARVRATWRGVPGHPVALGADHLAAAADPPAPARTRGDGDDGGTRETGARDTGARDAGARDAGARALLHPGPGVVLVEQHRDGPDADTPADLPPGTTLPAAPRPEEPRPEEPRPEEHRPDRPEPDGP